MPEIKSIRAARLGIKIGLSGKLNLLLLSGMVLIFGLLGYLTIRLHRQHLEQATLLSAERVSDVIRRSTTDYMLQNDRQGLYHSIQTMADEPGIVKVRIFDQEGRITYTTDPEEANHAVDKRAEACYACHAQSQPLTRLNRPDRFRIYRNPAGIRVLGIITPIENQPSCSSAACHAHPAEQKILGVLDTNLSLARTDQQLAESTRRMAAYTAFALLLIGIVSWFVVWRMLGVPLKALQHGTEHVADGDLGYHIAVHSNDEVGELASSFNQMSSELRAAHQENLAWTRTLEQRVEEKTRELKRAHEHALHNEKMASIGKMAAVLAHEINNPLSGILTYAKLLRKWIDRDDKAQQHHREICDSLDLIASESRRCGDLVKNLLTLSRETPLNLQVTDLNQIVEHTVRLVQHQLDLSAIHLDLQLDRNVPPVCCDASQIEQVLLALLVNAMQAMPQAGGNIWITTRVGRQEQNVCVVLRDDGPGIPADILPRIFEPFLTTKETGVGLGLAISRSILERHGGSIEVQSDAGRGTTFTMTLPGETKARTPVSPAEAVASSAGR
ncbi:MAG TPA: ATP-binding protein [Candidatus Aquilonibacter sp.]|nr:ATP-binding protein [Candidatus Aquilonibacter sp.]